MGTDGQVVLTLLPLKQRNYMQTGVWTNTVRPLASHHPTSVGVLGACSTLLGLQSKAIGGAQTITKDQPTTVA
jgi:hypothetical protein